MVRLEEAVLLTEALNRVWDIIRHSNIITVQNIHPTSAGQH